MFKLKVGDEIFVTSGGNKGKKGKIEKVITRENKIVVGGINIYKRHKKATKTQAAGIFEVTRPLPISNVALICPKCGKQTKVNFKEEGKNKVRVCKKCKGIITNKKESK
ncbi:MAG: 50S ribosomal protein L24 [Patescibacteria group bacterium]